MNIIGIPIGFYGYLFPGNINLMILELYSTKRYYFLSFMIVLVLFFESVYCFCTLYFLNQSAMKQDWFHYAEWFAYCLMLGMGIWMLFEKPGPLRKKTSNVYRGIISTIIHPQQIPFWLFMGVFLNGIFNMMLNEWSLPLFVFFNAIGTLLVLGCYAKAGHWLMAFFRINLYQINKTAGILYIIIAIFSLINHF